jgi:hypothetical protein
MPCQPPCEREVALDAPAGAIARQGAQLACFANVHDRRPRRDRHAEQRTGIFEELPLARLAPYRLGHAGQRIFGDLSRRPLGNSAGAVGRRPKRSCSNVEPIILLRRECEQRLPERALNRSELIAARALLFRSALFLDERDQPALKGLQSLRQRRISGCRG